jgi:hypothetical protein
VEDESLGLAVGHPLGALYFFDFLPLPGRTQVVDELWEGTEKSARGAAEKKVQPGKAGG